MLYLNARFFSSTCVGSGILKLTLSYIISLWQYGSKEDRVSQSSIIFGCSVMIWSMQDGVLLGSKFDSEIIRDNSREVSVSSSPLTSGVVLPSGHQKWQCALKSPVKNVAKGFSALIFEYKFLKFDRNI